MTGQSFSFRTTGFSSIGLRPGFGTSPKANLCRTSGTTAARQKSRLGAPEPPTARPVTAPVPKLPAERSPVRRSGQVSESRLQKRLASAERDISRLESRLNDLSDSIAIAGVDGHRERLEHLGVEYADAERQLDGAYRLWEELNGELEALAIVAPVA